MFAPGEDDAGFAEDFVIDMDVGVVCPAVLCSPWEFDCGVVYGEFVGIMACFSVKDSDGH